MRSSTEIFEYYRPRLFRLAYSMLGRVTSAEDAVQEAYIRWMKQQPDTIKSSEAFLSKVVIRICLDELKSARNRKEVYIGPDLPEPVIQDRSPEDELELADSLSMAMLTIMDTLTPAQRAVFLLREFFNYDYETISEFLNRPPAQCRKIMQRAKEQMRGKTPSKVAANQDQHLLISRFVDAITRGNTEELEEMLREEAVLYSDGGGKVTAAKQPVYGAPKIAKFLAGIYKQANGIMQADFRLVNGEPGMLVYKDSELFNVWSFHVDEAKIGSIYIVLNPEKLSHLAT